MKNKLEFVKGILCDIAGTVEFKKKPIEGAIDTIQFLKDKGIRIVFLTNTDSRTPRAMYDLLKNYGFGLKEEDIFTPIVAIKEYLKSCPEKKVFFLTTKEVKKEFSEANEVSDGEQPDIVVMGDFSDDWRVEKLDQVFKYVYNGAMLIGTQGNRYFLNKAGEPCIDTGAFVRMIANATQKDFKIMGKPSEDYFHFALSKIGLSPDEVIIVGDDLESDIRGGLNSKIRSILVRTGKGRDYNKLASDIIPYLTINSIKDLKKMME
ncbi:HAD-IIA family hydrolase [Candidatus Lokiarchaeum ossiferum]|uniref:HAD-IIA family hydrolase n=1 Tax=Candidatus Lokiarchaeum ossiferum TaxID=2951803 RepID=UPI00352F0ACF